MEKSLDSRSFGKSFTPTCHCSRRIFKVLKYAHIKIFHHTHHCVLLPSLMDTSSRYYASRYSTGSLCQYKLKNTTFLTLRVFGLQYQFILDKYGTIYAIQLFYGTNVMHSVVFQLKLAPTFKQQLPKANSINKQSSR